MSRIEELRRGKYELGRKEKARMNRVYGLTEKGTLSVREFLKGVQRFGGSWRRVFSFTRITSSRTTRVNCIRNWVERRPIGIT